MITIRSSIYFLAGILVGGGFIIYTTNGQSSLVLEIALSVIALAALFMSAFVAYFTVRHNQLSVKPHLVIDIDIGNYDRTLGVDITNVGLGPAVIKSFIVFLDGEEITERNKMSALMNAIFNDDLTASNTYEMDHTCVLATSEKRTLATAYMVKGAMVNGTDIIQILSSPSDNRIKFVVKYESLYGKQFTLEDSFV